MRNNVCIVGIGYIGLPMAAYFSDYYDVIGFDINKKKIDYLNKNKNFDQILNKEELKKLKQNKVKFTYKKKEIKDSKIYIVCVPTPITKNFQPDLKNLVLACKLIGDVLNINDTVIFESTVYPGVTNNICIPILEKKSGITCHRENNKNLNKKFFFCGFSPERVNPGDNKHSLKKIKKVISGSSNMSLSIIKNTYGKIMRNKLIKVSSIEIAEASKVIENTQRDVNIALINELSKIFYKSKLKFDEILKAASTKWNFLNFSPGLVGGHCIGVDPYYLSFYSKKIGYLPKLILSGRSINESMSKNVLNRIISCFRNKKIKYKNARILILGITFKRNVSDIRNSKVIDLVDGLIKKKINCYIYDPHIKDHELKSNYKIIRDLDRLDFKFDAVISAVNHDIFKKKINIILKKKIKEKSFIFEIMKVFPKKFVYESL